MRQLRASSVPNDVPVNILYEMYKIKREDLNLFCFHTEYRSVVFRYSYIIR